MNKPIDIVGQKCWRTTHGMARSPEWFAWCNMRRRCESPTANAFKHYGGRGITVCDRWRSFDNFLADMGPRLAGMSLDRIDVNGNYEPGNCRWATQKQQHSNTRQTKFVTFAGRTQCVTAWAEEIGICPTTLSYRLKRWPLERALTTKAMWS